MIVFSNNKIKLLERTMARARMLQRALHFDKLYRWLVGRGALVARAQLVLGATTEG